MHPGKVTLVLSVVFLKNKFRGELSTQRRLNLPYLVLKQHIPGNSFHNLRCHNVIKSTTTTTTTANSV